MTLRLVDTVRSRTMGAQDARRGANGCESPLGIVLLGGRS